MIVANFYKKYKASPQVVLAGQILPKGAGLFIFAPPWYNTYNHPAWHRPGRTSKKAGKEAVRLLMNLQTLRKDAARRAAWGQRLFCTALAMLLLLSEVFSSSIQSTLPTFSHLARLVLTGGAIALLLVKCVFFTQYESRIQWVIAVAAVGYAGFAGLYGDDTWFPLAVLVGLGAKGVDLRRALRVYLAVAAAGVVTVQLLHAGTDLIPFRYYARNWDFGYGHYNGYGGRLVGVFFAWGWLRWGRLRWWDWAGLAGLAAYTLLVPGCRGAGGAMVVLLVLFLAWKLCSKFFTGRLWQAFVTALYPVLTAASMLTGYFFDPENPGRTPLLASVNRLLSGRFEVWHHVFWARPYTHPAEDGVAAWYHGDLPNTLTLLGGLPTDGDVHHSIDNTYLALVMNKGLLGAVVIGAVITFLAWRLVRHGHVGESLCLAAMLLYFLMENKPFLLSANPLVLLLPCALLTPRGADLPVLCERPAKVGRQKEKQEFTAFHS